LICITFEGGFRCSSTFATRIKGLCDLADDDWAGGEALSDQIRLRLGAVPHSVAV